VLLSYAFLVVSGIGQQHPPDFAAFYAAARAVRTGGWDAFGHLYAIHFQQAHHFPEPFENPPTAAWVVVPFTLLPFSSAFLTWTAISFGLGAAGTYWLASQELPPSDVIPIALAALACYPTYMAMGEGQYDLLWPLCIALVSSAPAVPGVRRWVPRIIGGTFLFSFKPDLMIAFVIPALQVRRSRRVHTAALCLIGLAIGSLATIGISGLADALRLQAFALFVRFPPDADTTVLGFLWHVLGPGRASETLAAVSIVVGTGVFGLAWWRNPPVTPSDWRFAVSSAMCLSLLIAPHALNHSLVLLVGPIIWTARAMRERGISLWALTGSLVALNAVLIVDVSPLVTVPFPLTPVALLMATLALWQARRLPFLPAGTVQVTV
jgi:hypothetical protein